MNCIFISKGYYNEDNIISNQIPIINPVHIIFSDLFGAEIEGKFEIEIDQKIYKFSYKNMNSTAEAFYFNIMTDYTPSLNAKVLSSIYKKITNGEHRAKFNIVLAYDDASEYYCNKLYPKLNELERKVRDLVFSIVIEAYGSRWFIDTVPDKIKKEIEERGNINKNKLVENALYEMTIGQVEDYLFSKWRNTNAEDFLNINLKLEKITELTKDEITLIIENNQPQSLWDRIFSTKVKIENVQHKMQSVRTCRNIVAHSKLLSFNEFEEYQLLIKEFIKEINQAIIFMTENDEFKPNLENALENLSKSMLLFSEIMKSVIGPTDEIANNFRKSLEPFFEASNRISLNFQNIFSSNFYEAYYAMINKLNNKLDT